MRAYILVKGTMGPRDLKRTERPDPKPGPREILVRMRAAALNYRDQIIARDGRPAGKLQNESIPMSDGAGEVVEIGEAVTRFKVGDRVTSTFDQGWIAGPYGDKFYPSLGQDGVDGVLAEYALFNEENAVKAPEGLSFEEAACLPCAAVTAWNALTVGNMRAGQSVLTLGTGGVAVFAVQFAKAAGCSVIATSSSDEKLRKVKALGADQLINYAKTPDWDVAVREMTGGRGVDHVVETGGAATIERSYRSVANSGNIGLIAFSYASSETQPMTLPRWGQMHRIAVGNRETFEAMNRAITANGIKPVVDRVFPFEQAIDAYEYELAGKHFGKVVISI
jgi:NADPH:quinone reductase-like Zn-dependent oxidoreductase